MFFLKVDQKSTKKEIHGISSFALFQVRTNKEIEESHSYLHIVSDWFWPALCQMFLCWSQTELGISDSKHFIQMKLDADSTGALQIQPNLTQAFFGQKMIKFSEGNIFKGQNFLFAYWGLKMKKLWKDFLQFAVQKWSPFWDRRPFWKKFKQRSYGYKL